MLPPILSAMVTRLLALLQRYPAVAAFVLFAVVGLSIDRDTPVTDDARFYVPAAASYGNWLVRAITLDGDALSRSGIDRAFAVNHEHPPVAKYVMALGWLLLHRWSGWTDEVTACRAGITLLWALMCALVFAAVSRVRGTNAGAFAAGALVLMPRVLFHGQVETLDLPVAALLLASSWALWRSLETRRWLHAGLTVLLFALALGCKLNAPFFLLAALAYGLIVWPPRLSWGGLISSPIPLVLVGLVVISPLVTWLSWPWLWFDTWARLQSYIHFHIQHYGILFYYGGKLYGDEVAPWHAAWVMTALTVSVPILLMAVIGTYQPLAAVIRQIGGLWRSTSAASDGPTDNADGSDAARFAQDDEDTAERSDGRASLLADADPSTRLGLLALLQALVQLIAVSLPGVPAYGGVKLFLPAFPFIAILAGLGFSLLWREIFALALSERWRFSLAAATFSVLLLPGLIGVVAYHGTWLSYYNELGGGLRGAAACGFERQYYDLGYPELPRTLNALLADGGSVAFLPNPKEYGPYMSRWQRDHRLLRSIRRAPPERADLLVLTHERRWQQYPDLQARFRNYRLVAQRRVADVPLYSIYDLRMPLH
jgi:4-amino-4-deoxy-L-arabinose transferase-like glycosyltransferase